LLRKALEEDGWKVVTEGGESGDGNGEDPDFDSADDYSSSDDDDEESDEDIYA